MGFKLYFKHLEVGHNKPKEPQENNSDYKEPFPIHKLLNLHFHIPMCKYH